MRFFSLIFLVSCGGGGNEGGEFPSIGGEQGVVEGPNGPSAENIPIAGDGEVQARISGIVDVPGYIGQAIQFDALAQFEGQSVVVANERYDAPGEFRLVVRGEHESVDIVVYLDVDGDGPSQGDFRYEYVNNPIALNPVVGEVVEILGLELLVVDDGQAADGGVPSEATPLVEGEGQPPVPPEMSGVPSEMAAVPPEMGANQVAPEVAPEVEAAPAED